MADRDALHILGKVDFLSSLDPETLKALLDKLQPAEFAAGADLCAEGEEGDRMFIIQAGEVAVIKKGVGETPIEVAVLGPGSIAGEMSLLGKMVRSATLRAKTDVSALVLDHESFGKLLEERCALARAMMYWLSTHLRRETSTVARLLSTEVDPRFKVAFFDSKPYMREVFEENNRYDYAYRFYESRLSSETVSIAAGCDAVCVFVNDSVNAEVIEELSGMNINMVALRCAGFNNVDLDACAEHGVSVARVPAYSPYAVAEHAVALAMTLNRQTHRANNRVREGNFSLSGLVGFDMHGKTVGIVGTGKIGKCAIRIFVGLGCRVVAYDKFPDEAAAEELGYEYVELDRLLADADIISLHAPLFPETRHMIDANAVARMKNGVMIINTSRGALIDTSALLSGLKSGHVGFAGLDVYEEESAYFFEDHSDRVMTDDLLARLTTFNNVIVTSHQAFLTREALTSIAQVTVDNLREYQTGKRMAGLANAVMKK